MTLVLSIFETNLNSLLSDYQKEKYSKSHHYLPVFYLKGFADDEGLICVYDKVRDAILTKQKPESKFYENHLNNFRVNGEVKFTLEETLFSEIDSECSAIFRKIQDPNFLNDTTFTPQEKNQIFRFIIFLFWRLPESNKHFIEIIKKEGLSNKYFGFRRKGETDFIPDEELGKIKDDILNDLETQKVFKYAVPFSDSTKQEIYRIYDKWNFCQLDTHAVKFITGDNPFLINNEDMRLGNIFNELIFPTGKNNFLLLTDKPPKFLDSFLTHGINLSILHQSKRFVTSDSEENLREMLKFYNRMVQQNLEKNLIKSTFGVMYHQSTFKDYDEYFKTFQAAKMKM